MHLSIFSTCASWKLNGDSKALLMSIICCPNFFIERMWMQGRWASSVSKVRAGSSNWKVLLPCKLSFFLLNDWLWWLRCWAPERNEWPAGQFRSYGNTLLYNWRSTLNQTLNLAEATVKNLSLKSGGGQVTTHHLTVETGGSKVYLSENR